jgi:hypothetical protein
MTRKQNVKEASVWVKEASVWVKEASIQVDAEGPIISITRVSNLPLP